MIIRYFSRTVASCSPVAFGVKKTKKQSKKFISGAPFGPKIVAV